jgi:hypothetical protein
VTYPEELVQSAISGWFVPCAVNVKDEAMRDVVERFHHAWTPDFRVVDGEGNDLYRWNGFLPPAEFVPQLLMAGGYARLALWEPDRAVEMLQAVLRRFPTSGVAPEANYYLGIARFKASRDREDLHATWRSLQHRYPDTVWREKQVYIEDPLPEP